MATRTKSKNTSTTKRASSKSSKKSTSPLNKWLQNELALAKKHPAITFGGLLVIVIALLLAFPFRFLVIPATVNGQPIFSWKYVSELNKTAGSQVLDRMISEILIEQEVAKLGIQVAQDEIDEQIRQIEEQFGQGEGGLESVLALQGLTRDEFIKQLRLNLSLEKLVEGTIEVSDEDIAEELSTNAELYESLAEVDAATTAAENIRGGKIQEAFQTWFQEVQSTANIQNFIEAETPTIPDIPQQ